MIGKIEAAYSARGEDPPFGLNASSLEVLQKHLAVKRSQDSKEIETIGRNMRTSFECVPVCRLSVLNLWVCKLFHHASTCSVELLLSCYVCTSLRSTHMVRTRALLTARACLDAEGQHDKCVVSAAKRSEISRCSWAEINSWNFVLFFYRVAVPDIKILFTFVICILG